MGQHNLASKRAKKGRSFGSYEQESHLVMMCMATAPVAHLRTDNGETSPHPTRNLKLLFDLTSTWRCF
ncbi:hypothetical protein CEXT_73691 [Caerostris extrusa]|uniref:Uncharacterized protein n=1 Tax=Caerostris extrusa TaxID=172846 RepID=A0AAV4M939_CAEEX|nr:hypothetical protein CEXT_73691 [Caerostris extrusa]